MVKRYRLILFILLACAYCYFVYFIAYKWTYKDLQENKLYDENALTKESEADPAINIIDEAYEENTVTAKTTYILEKYEITSGEYTNEILPVPIEVLGMDKDELYSYYVNYSNMLKNSDDAENTFLTDLSESDIITGIKTMELVNFENNVLVVRMTYEYKEPEYKFVLVEENNRIVVYRLSNNEIFANTDIRLQDLPYALRTEIQNGKYFASEIQLYYFLESYSS